MPWTTHGYWSGLREPTEPGPPRLDCGGPHRCVQCAAEAHQLEAETAMTTVDQRDGDIDLGDGVHAVYVNYGAHRPGGLIEYHRDPDGRECFGSVLFDLDGIRQAFPERPVWTVEQWEPLTLSPSILCRRCGHHGWIRAGRWVGAGG